MSKIRIVCVSDTHEMQKTIAIPEGDILLHAGDITMMGDPGALIQFNTWCAQIVESGIVKSIVCIAGNHDFLFERQPAYARSLIKSAAYLEDSSAEIAGLKIHGTPWQPWFYDWAFNLKTEEELMQMFEKIPDNTDVVVCHTPPYGILDRNYAKQPCGSKALRETVLQKKPKLVVFGHIHESYGMIEQEGITFVNASICTLAYKPTNPPVVIELEI